MSEVFLGRVTLLIATICLAAAATSHPAFAQIPPGGGFKWTDAVSQLELEAAREYEASRTNPDRCESYRTVVGRFVELYEAVEHQLEPTAREDAQRRIERLTFARCPPTTASQPSPASAPPPPPPRAADNAGAVFRATMDQILFRSVAMAIEAGGLRTNPDYTLAGSSFTPPVSGTVSPSAGYFGLDMRFGAGIFEPLRQQFLLRASTTRTDQIVSVGPFVGMKVRRYFDQSGNELGVSVHPGPAIDTTMSFQQKYALKAYVGWSFLWRNPAIAETILEGILWSPYVGVNTVWGDLTLFTDENGPTTLLRNRVSQTGRAIGMDVDFLFKNLPFFIGLGVQLDFMPAVTLSGFSVPNRFLYQYTSGEDIAYTIGLRLGWLFGPSLADSAERALSRSVREY